MEVDWSTVIWVAVILYTLAQWLFRRQRHDAGPLDEAADTTAYQRPSELESHTLAPPPPPPQTFERQLTAEAPAPVDPLEGLYPPLEAADWLGEPLAEAAPMGDPEVAPPIQSTAAVELPPEVDLQKPLVQVLKPARRQRAKVVFRTRDDLQRAVVSAEVLGKPVALRD